MWVPAAAADPPDADTEGPKGNQSPRSSDVHALPPAGQAPGSASGRPTGTHLPRGIIPHGLSSLKVPGTAAQVPRVREPSPYRKATSGTGAAPEVHTPEIRLPDIPTRRVGRGGSVLDREEPIPGGISPPAWPGGGTRPGSGPLSGALPRGGVKLSPRERGTPLYLQVCFSHPSLCDLNLPQTCKLSRCFTQIQWGQNVQNDEADFQDEFTHVPNLQNRG